MPRGRTAAPGEAPAEEMAPNPFTRASDRLTEEFYDKTIRIGSAAQSFDIVEIPARGFLRGVWLWVSMSDGTAGSAAVKPGWPYTALERVEIQDVNSAPIVSLSGQQLAWVNQYGGYQFAASPRDSADYGAGTVSGGCWLWVPIEVRSRDAMGSLANQSAAGSLRLRLTLAGSGDVYSTAPTKLPNVRVRCYDEHWAPPQQQDLSGRPNALTPPGLGTTSYWTTETHTVSNGSNTIRLQRVGNYIRNLLIVGRNASGQLSDTAIPDPLELRYDGTILQRMPLKLWREKTRRNTPRAIAANDTPAGVVLVSYCDDLDGHQGEELGNFYLPTTSATRFEIRGDTSAAGAMTILINDLAPGQSGTLY